MSNSDIERKAIFEAVSAIHKESKDIFTNSPFVTIPTYLKIKTIG